ncbi:mechanosensitive ion channel family protein [Candidatus Atribacteria bacterium 1244-E10-H5-B2]|nr:MAG: mechanosensitive ion channel family protein [Candidatus Atribacteria bacterium 1244-E10-H5-B2]
MFIQYVNSFYQAVLSFFSPENLILWWGKFITIIIILVVAKIILSIVNKFIEKSLTPLKKSKNYKKRISRANTLIPLLQNISKYVLYFISGVMVLRELGVDTTAIIASAGVVGLAIGFGAQSLVKDILSGAFLLFEGIISVGDSVNVGEHSGTVEVIGLRNIHLRKYSGELRVIPYGEVASFGNFNKGYMRAIVKVGVAYEQDVEKGMKTLEEIADKWAEENKDIVLEAPIVQGVLSLGSSEVTLRVSIKVKPMTHWGAERELKRRIKDTFDKKGIEIPFPRQVVYLKKEKK